MTITCRVGMGIRFVRVPIFVSVQCVLKYNCLFVSHLLPITNLLVIFAANDNTKIIRYGKQVDV